MVKIIFWVCIGFPVVKGNKPVHDFALCISSPGDSSLCKSLCAISQRYCRRKNLHKYPMYRISLVKILVNLFMDAWMWKQIFLCVFNMILSSSFHCKLYSFNSILHSCTIGGCGCWLWHRHPFNILCSGRRETSKIYNGLTSDLI